MSRSILKLVYPTFSIERSFVFIINISYNLEASYLFTILINIRNGMKVLLIQLHV